MLCVLSSNQPLRRALFLALFFVVFHILSLDGLSVTSDIARRAPVFYLIIADSEELLSVSLQNHPVLIREAFQLLEIGYQY